MARLAVIGDKTSVLGFKPLGLDVYPAEQKQAVEESWQKMQEQDYAAIFVTEDVYLIIKEKVLAISEQLTPAILIIPGAGGRQGLGFDRIKKIVEMAIGVDILSSKEGK